MEKRLLEKLKIETSLLGFGCMRFPEKDGKIDEKKAEAMMDLAIANGVNYIDTAYPYHNGDSETFVGKVLNKYDRKSYFLATKLPVWEIHSVEDAKRMFAYQLKRLDKEYIDFYLLHALDLGRWRQMKDLGVVEYLEELKAEGKIKYLGFSFHDEYSSFEEIIRAKSWDFCQIQFNYMDTKEQAGLKGYELAQELEIPVIVMEPIRGGSLAEFSDDINEMFKVLDPNASTASFALRYVGSFSNVKVILSGMSTMEQVEDNLKTFKEFVPLNEQEDIIIEQVVTTLRKRIQNGCTACGYCMPCPVGVDIPGNFKIWNNTHIYQKLASFELFFMGEGSLAKNCIKCGKCEPKCPQKISIREDLGKAQLDFDSPVWKN